MQKILKTMLVIFILTILPYYKKEFKLKFRLTNYELPIIVEFILSI